MKKLLLAIFLLGYALTGRSAHITGGEMIYDFVSATATTKTYDVTLMLFRDENCSNCAVMPTVVWIGLYNNDNGNLFGGTGSNNYYVVDLDRIQNVPLNSIPDCITNPPTLQYRVGFYVFRVTLPNNNNGYTASYQTCCRIDNIMNVGNSVGGTYTCTIPGLNSLGAGIPDSSPRFSREISIACFNNPFTLNFSATDPDGDQLVYSMCSAYNGGAATNSNNIIPSGPPYSPVVYTNGFDGNNPLGNQASINPQTGIISGIAPDAGRYVVSVCVISIRNGNVINEHRKDFIVTIAPCDLPSAQLLTPYYISCDGYTLSFANLSSSPLNNTSFWDFGDPASGANNNSTLDNPTHTFSDTGIFVIKLVVNQGTSCVDSSISSVRVYPGFRPGFRNNSPMCKDKPVQFTDTTYARYGVVDYWKWDFGVTTIQSDTSRIRNPVYSYSQTGTYTATLIVSTSKGCIDTIQREVTIVDKPEFRITNDTLICSVDTLRLQAIAGASGGAVSWTPNFRINNVNSFSPLVWPNVNTRYIARFSDSYGCVAFDTVNISVVDSVTLSINPDTTICRTDPVTLNPQTNALQFNWTPSESLDDPRIKNPTATTNAPLTTYYVTAKIGKCTDRDSIKVRTIPYPVARATKDTAICFGESVPLIASGGSSYVWTPSLYLSNPFISNPVSVQPAGDIAYILSVRDTLGCPKPGKDTVFITVKRVIANAGPRDTSIVLGQPLQLQATGGTVYQWAPVTQWLSATQIANPVATPQNDIEYVVQVASDIGCSDTDSILVKVFKVAPGFYIPTAFSPNGDGLNEIIRPIALGMKSVDVFMIYNRWGQLLYRTSTIGEGWDGRYAGKEQAPGTYVWYAEGTDYLNQRITRKGNVVLIR